MNYLKELIPSQSQGWTVTSTGFVSGLGEVEVAVKLRPVNSWIWRHCHFYLKVWSLSWVVWPLFSMRPSPMQCWESTCESERWCWWWPWHLVSNQEVASETLTMLMCWLKATVFTLCDFHNSNAEKVWKKTSQLWKTSRGTGQPLLEWGSWASRIS